VLAFCLVVFVVELYFGVAPNGLPLAAVGDFGELHCQPSTNVDARQNVQLTTEPAFLQNRRLALQLPPSSRDSKSQKTSHYFKP